MLKNDIEESEIEILEALKETDPKVFKSIV
jgi:hypothetical protein